MGGAGRTELVPIELLLNPLWGAALVPLAKVFGRAGWSRAAKRTYGFALFWAVALPLVRVLWELSYIDQPFADRAGEMNEAAGGFLPRMLVVGSLTGVLGGAWLCRRLLREQRRGLWLAGAAAGAPAGVAVYPLTHTVAALGLWLATAAATVVRHGSPVWPPVVGAPPPTALEQVWAVRDEISRTMPDGRVMSVATRRDGARNGVRAGQGGRPWVWEVAVWDATSHRTLTFILDNGRISGHTGVGAQPPPREDRPHHLPVFAASEGPNAALLDSDAALERLETAAREARQSGGSPDGSVGARGAAEVRLAGLALRHRSEEGVPTWCATYGPPADGIAGWTDATIGSVVTAAIDARTGDLLWLVRGHRSPERGCVS